MASGLNRVILIGNLGQDPELRFTQGGQAILNLRLACSESWVDKDGERKERTEWVTCILWGKRGEALAKFLTKGSKLCAEGRLQTRSWEAKDGSKRYATEVVASNIILLGGRPGGGGGYDDGPPPLGDDYGPKGGGGFGDSEIPFMPEDGRLR